MGLPTLKAHLLATYFAIPLIIESAAAAARTKSSHSPGLIVSTVAWDRESERSKAWIAPAASPCVRSNSPRNIRKGLSSGWRSIHMRRMARGSWVCPWSMRKITRKLIPALTHLFFQHRRWNAVEPALGEINQGLSLQEQPI